MSRAEELQHAAPEEFWARFAAVMGGPDGLMTYRYLGTRPNLDDVGTAVMPLRRDMRNPAGGLLAAPLSISLADAGGVKSDAGGVPAPVTSTTHLLDTGEGVSRVHVRTSGLHQGRTIGFSHGEVVDADDPGRILAVTTGTGVNVGEAPPGYAFVEPGESLPDSPDLPPLHEAFGATRRSDGCWQLPELSQRIGSTSGSLHLGPIQVVMEAAAMELAAQAAGTDQLQIEDWSVMYMQRGKIGPFVVTGRAVPARDRFAVRLSLRDEGNADRVVTSALAVFRRA
jgi:acyl-coenzyme A thioesterase PaaI-like protein